MSKLHLGDTREILKQYPDNYFDCVVSDVPYKIGTSGVGSVDRLKKRWIKKDTDEDNQILIKTGKLFEHADIKFSEWLPEVYRVLKDGTHAYFMVNGRNLKELQVEAEKVGFKYQNLLVWVKNNKTPNKFYMQRVEFILMLRKGREKYINDMGCDNVFTHPNICGKKYHPTEKPVDLMKHFILNSTNEGDIVLDPFMGAGSTCIACRDTNREYVGIEIEEKYYNVAMGRLENKILTRGSDKQQMELF